MSQPCHGVVEDVDAIADVFVELTHNAHEVTLRFDATPVHYPVSVVSVDRISASCLLDITSLGDIDELLARRYQFILHARQESASLRSSTMQIRRVVSRSGRLGLHCDFPQQLRYARRRGYFRAALSDGMTVTVELAAPDGQCWQALLCDLSIGGCLLALPASQPLPELDAQLQLRARFPNGEVFKANSRLRHIQAGEGDTMQMGVRFDIGMAEHERRVWFYVREIERESVRQRRTPSETRPLAPSRLFQITSDDTGSD
ncbi:flagellar brake protein [Kushneria phosphatilytica]|uniref:Uncharacterized protein n=1 Tax=Kushneria phosphatilytica TaxID=657387 RepID=A0A1S1NWF8_9GAMM|nr:PilZ domain-containing protein [Kushneria phosphatilytica]OHV09982.1 hypothetical protein BH688_10225 [Kushneria phosphatilytica]QEL11663.1 hypothetical protein FY550_11300 [Kushneria phosphatilytica]